MSINIPRTKISTKTRRNKLVLLINGQFKLLVTHEPHMELQLDPVMLHDVSYFNQYCLYLSFNWLTVVPSTDTATLDWLDTTSIARDLGWLSWSLKLFRLLSPSMSPLACPMKRN